MRPLLLPLLPLLLLACAAPQAEPAPARRAQPAKEGALIVSEIFASPVGNDQEWIEVYNTTDKVIDLKDWTLQDDKNEHVIGSSVLVGPGSYAVLGQSDDPKANGGVAVDYAYGSKIGLSGGGDEVHLLDPSGDEIDAVVYGSSDPWPPQVEGVALQLDAAKLDASANDEGASWCLAVGGFGTEGGKGTPGKANDACGAGGQGGSAGSGQAGSSQAGSSQAGSAGAAGSAGSGGQGAQAGQGGASGCQVRFHKIDVNQPDADAGPKDTAEAVELQVQGAFEPGKTTLADCGVATVSPYDADADAQGVCGPAAGTYAELAVGDLPVPASGFVVVGNIAAADRAWKNDKGEAFAVLKNGPDLLALRSASGQVLVAVSYADNDAPDVHASCPALPGAALLPADANSDASPAANQVLALCPDGSWQLVAEGDAPWKAENTCPGGAGQGGSAQAGSGGSSQTGGAGAGGAGAGSGQGGSAQAGSGGSSQAGSSQAGGAGKSAGVPDPVAGSSGQGGAAGAQAADAPAAEDGDCSCRAPGRGASGGSLGLSLALGAAALRRRRARR